MSATEILTLCMEKSYIFHRCSSMWDLCNFLRDLCNLFGINKPYFCVTKPFKYFNMKTIKLLVVCLTILIAGFAQGQVAVNVNMGTPPAWGPAGYSDVRYYYLPDMEVYYDVQRSNFIYLCDNRWVYRTSLPVQYKNYNLYRGYKVPLQNYSGNYPFFFFKQHKVKYARIQRKSSKKHWQ